MTNVPVIDCVRHYQRSIERANNDEKKLLHCFAKLYKLPITVDHLSETGIGKTVNNFRKVEGEVGLTAKALVAKWKTMVADARENSPEEQAPVTAYEPVQSDNEQQNHINNSIKVEKSHQHKSRHEHRKDESLKQKEKDRSHRETHSERSERKERERLEKEKEKERHRREKQKAIEQNVERKQNEHKKDRSDQQQPTTSNSIDIKEIKREKQNHQHYDTKKGEERTHKHSKHERHKEQKHEKSSSHRDHESKQHHKSSSRTEKRANTESVEDVAKKRTKMAHKSEEVAEEVNDDGIDSSMGANFEDVLGALNMSAGSSRKFKKSATNNAHNKPSSSSATNKSMESASTSKKAAELQKPILLTSAAKLQPLDPNLTLELPTISNNYRPMPLNKTVMDCVFNNSSNGNSSKTPTRMFSDSDALAHGISSKTMRTKIYSGVKSGQVFQVPSLFNLCIRLLQKNIDALEYTGGVPYEVLKPVLERATPEQLFVFEEYNPYILEDSDELWKMHVQRKYRTQKRQEMEAWREMFMRCREDEALRLSRLTETIKQKEIMVSAPIKKTQMAFVDSYAKPPRNVARKQEIFGTRAKLIATPAARVAALSSVTPNAASIGDVRLRVAASTSRDTAQASSSSSSRPKKAPLMAKTLQLMRGRLKR